MAPGTADMGVMAETTYYYRVTAMNLGRVPR